MSRLVNDLMEIAELAHHGPENLFISSIMLVGSFIMLAAFNLADAHYFYRDSHYRLFRR